MAAVFFWAIQLGLIAAKLTETVDWSWWVIFAPLIGFAGLISLWFVFAFLFLFVALVAKL